MKSLVVPVFLAAGLLLASCGGGGGKMNSTDKAFADLTLSTYGVRWSDCLVKLTKDGSCGEFDLERITDNFLADVRKFREQGYPQDELVTQLRDDADELEGYCPVCVSKLDREREGFD